MKCANCTADAFYVYRLTLNKEILYCAKHLPTFLEARKNAGLLPTTETYKTIVEDGIKNLAVETVVEPEPELEVVPIPTPKKKTTKKAATKNAPNS